MTTKPDADKLLRGCTDPLTGVLWKDDAQVIEAVVRKTYVSDRPAGARITVTEVR
jgi:Holliday junction resolvase RusA-like endonuclease